jgi:DHA1 family inner membrane transport protein
VTSPPSAQTGLSPARVRLALLALALGGFGIGCTEFVAMGLLPNIAHDLLPALFAVSVEQANAQAGLLVTAYAAGVVVGAPTIAAVAARWPRKIVLICLLGIIILGTVASAVLPTFGLVVVARFCSALPHGAYFGIAALVAASMMGPGKRGKGIALVFAGLTVANVVGVPAITFIGQSTNWRVAYLVVAGVFVLALIAIALTVPSQPGNPSATMKQELTVFRRPQVWLTAAIGAIGFGGFFCVYTFVSPIVTSVTGLSASVVPLALVSVGIGMTIGNLLGGWFADRNLKRSILGFYGALVVILAALALVAANPVGLFIGLLLVGVAASAISPLIQTRLMDVAGDSQTIGAALNHSALNAGNALGPILGGLAITAGFGYLAPIWIGVVLTLLGIGIAITSFSVERRTRRRVATAVATRATVSELV